MMTHTVKKDTGVEKRIGQEHKQEGWERWDETESDLWFRKLAWLSGWKVTGILLEAER